MAKYSRQRNVTPQRTQIVAPAPAAPVAAPALEREEPMHRYVHHIPAPRPTQMYHSADVQSSLDYIAERLAEENQLLLDILGAVNGLTAAILSNQRHNS